MKKERMTIVTWNCARAFNKKHLLLESIKSDLAIIPECESLEKLGDSCKRMFPRAVWFGDNLNKGLGVFANTQYELSVHPAYDERFKWVVPIRVTNGRAVNFTLIAVWTKKLKDQKLSYIGQLFMALQQYESLLQKETCLIIGDFNSNVIWDKKRWMNHSEVVEMLRKYGIESAYHWFYGEEQGQETRPTHYFRYNRNMPFHIDYAFIPVDWMNRLETVDVGTYDEWRYAAPSDHVPLILKLG